MPAERKRGAKKEEGEGIQLTWTAPVEPAMPQHIAFAPTMTPGTFTEPCSTPEPDTEPSLFPSTVGVSCPRRPGHGKKKADNHIPRPPNAFILFRSSFIKSQHVSSEVETNHSTLSKIIGITWQNMPHEERQFWHSKAKIAQAEHKRKFPDYAFRPLHLKGKGTTDKRKVREVGPKDIKRCEKIAELLVEGKKGAELEAAIQEFDRHHIPPVITRFEAPLTARMYRRSSSEPAPDTDTSSPAFLVSSPKTSSRRLRAVSSQPGRSRSPSVKPEMSFPSATSTPPGDLSDDSMPPLVLPPLSPPDFSNYSLSSTPEQSFINPFIYNEAPASYTDSCDPLSPPPDGLSPFEGMWTAQQIPHPSNQHDVFEMTHPSIDTSVSNEWPSSPSQFSSPPSTPYDFANTCISPISIQSDAGDRFLVTQQTMAAFSGDNFDNHGAVPQSMFGPGDYASPYQQLDATVFHSNFSLLPSKGAFAFLTYNNLPENAHQDVSFSDYLAEPLLLPNFAQ